MKIKPGEAIAIDVTSNNSGDPPIGLRWRPQPGTTTLTVTLTTPEGETSSREFTIYTEAAA